MINEDAIYELSHQIVVREIENEIVIVPLSQGIGDLDDQLYSLNESGKAILEKIDGQKPVKQIASELAEEFEEDLQTIREDVFALIGEFEKRDFLKIVS